MMIQRVKELAYVGAVLTLMIGCRTQKEIAQPSYIDGAVLIEGCTCVDVPGEGTDSRVGVLECGDVSFYYDYGRYSYTGPMTIEEDFRQSFDTYHHIKFFKDRMIDPKVNKLFLDSVQVINVGARGQEKLMFQCDPCNAVAEVTFKKDTYYYPLTLSEDQLGERGFDADIYKIGPNTYKVYQEGADLPGLYVTPSQNRFKKKNCLSLTVKESTLGSEAIKKVLRSVRLQHIATEPVKN